MHLATNARSAMPHGGALRISTSFNHGHSGPNRDMPLGPCAVLTVSDTGVGLDEQTRQCIFEPFFTTRESAISGLGLATVHGIIAQSKGRIECDSNLGHGTTFRVYLPIGALPSAPAVTAAENSSHRLLLAEDDHKSTSTSQASIKTAGFLLDSVCNG